MKILTQVGNWKLIKKCTRKAYLRGAGRGISPIRCINGNACTSIPVEVQVRESESKIGLTAIRIDLWINGTGASYEVTSEWRRHILQPLARTSRSLVRRFPFEDHLMSNIRIPASKRRCRGMATITDALRYASSLHHLEVSMCITQIRTSMSKIDLGFDLRFIWSANATCRHYSRAAHNVCWQGFENNIKCQKSLMEVD